MDLVTCVWVSLPNSLLTSFLACLHFSTSALMARLEEVCNEDFRYFSAISPSPKWYVYFLYSLREGLTPIYHASIMQCIFSAGHFQHGKIVLFFYYEINYMFIYLPYWQHGMGLPFPIKLSYKAFCIIACNQTAINNSYNIWKEFPNRQLGSTQQLKVNIKFLAWNGWT